jgi:hypothetical protein
VARKSKKLVADKDGIYTFLCGSAGMRKNRPEIRISLDIDGDIHRADISSILRARRKAAQGPDDPMDADGDGMITRFDVTRCARLVNQGGG